MLLPIWRVLSEARWLIVFISLVAGIRMSHRQILFKFSCQWKEEERKGNPELEAKTGERFAHLPGFATCCIVFVFTYCFQISALAIPPPPKTHTHTHTHEKSSLVEFSYFRTWWSEHPCTHFNGPRDLLFMGALSINTYQTSNQTWKTTLKHRGTPIHIPSADHMRISSPAI